jgi:protein-disulfide isomerase
MNKSAIFLTITTIVLIVGALILAKMTGTANRQEATTVAKSELVKADSYRLGPADAPVTLVEFADFQCPACGSVAPILKQVVDEGDDNVSLVLRHYPLPIHNNAKIAAQAAEAAGQQGKFWEMSTVLFERQTEWAENGAAQTIFTRYAEELDLDQARFASDLSNNTLRDKIERDAKEAGLLNLSGTPSLFINGQPYRGSLDYPSLKDAVEAARK